MEKKDENAPICDRVCEAMQRIQQSFDSKEEYYHTLHLVSSEFDISVGRLDQIYKGKAYKDEDLSLSIRYQEKQLEEIHRSLLDLNFIPDQVPNEEYVGQLIELGRRNRLFIQFIDRIYRKRENYDPLIMEIKKLIQKKLEYTQA